MPESALHLDALPQERRAALMQAVLDTLDLQEEGMGALPTLRAGIREVAAQKKLGQVISLLQSNEHFSSQDDIDNLKEILRQEVALYDFERRYAQEMTKEEEGAVISFIKRHKVAIAVVVAALATGGIAAGLHSAGFITLTRLPFSEPVQAFFASASETVQGWWSSLQQWWTGGGDATAESAANTEAGEAVQEAVRSQADSGYDPPVDPNYKPVEVDRSHTAPLDDGADPFTFDDGAENATSND